MNRRIFLAAGAAAAGAAGNTPRLAVEGGAPVRETPLHADFWGTSFYGDEETAELTGVACGLIRSTSGFDAINASGMKSRIGSNDGSSGWEGGIEQGSDVRHESTR